MSVVYVNGSSFDPVKFQSTRTTSNDEETDSALGSSHSNSTHSPDIPALDRDVHGEERFEDYGAAEEAEPELLAPFGEKKSVLNTVNGGGAGFNRTASVRRSFRRPSPATVRRTPSFGISNSSMKGSPGTHPHAHHDDPDADDWNSVDSFQRDDDVYHLTQQMEKLQNQVSVLVQSQANQEDNVSKLRQDNAGLTERCTLLEEQLREQEMKYEERLKNEHRKNMDLLQRLERDKNNELENRNNRITTLEVEVNQLRNESLLVKAQAEKFKLEKAHYQDKLIEAERQMSELSEEAGRLKETLRREREDIAKKTTAHDQELIELQLELEQLRSYKIENERYTSTHNRIAPERVRELESELQRVKQENVKLEESNQELNTHLLHNQVEQGRALLRTDMGSLFSEFSDTTRDEAVEALKEYNRQLKEYVDRILAGVLERAPELLEIRWPTK
ncbi:rab11 family-interacting protein 4B-like [Paramacrobiotus metropolitanus]|uniref:rab11 family-interacting protein 4B-like n=1 Tax=Paramacrobiotus metropolitanus TaxID=2943436 RepID=UPI00244601B5|nr:rab11 family-interacting protein 4B-like [Paramacrobiotus metropolitanus]XP_055338727.1 rab11 family-interacting protein 4B-like [Paramacrobiotus metropolitanus]XP_055338728.1 rab11 family-interacting protein 4B-like [Paramacrobiotus metropolitanus]XP_055338729.1 rab11 family-interacting protein 4B-like [Paramacrobiotus metropolitanus]XP_055338730.1 rab11 family-interacting protein 4B-like [Paramacrobiotus metropolitanus]XP_055338731.1 rab11 family-interacting protein 4B-like [Paramacrobiot